MKIKDILKGVIFGSDYIFPLWKELLGGLVIFLGLSSFCSAFVVSLGGGYFDSPNTTGYFEITPINGSTITYGGSTYSAIRFRDNPSVNGYFLVSYSAGTYSLLSLGPNQRATLSAGDYDISCSSNPCVVAVRFSNPVNVLSGMCPSCPTCPSQYTSEECQSEYDLVPSSDLSTCQSDLSSCQSSNSGYDTLLNNCSTNLNSCTSSLSSCLQLNCPISTGGVSWSSLFINNIQHVGAPTINISIPSEIQWDYLNENDEFNLTIDGYNTDADYIEGIINLQNSKPTKEDLTDIITKVIPLFVPGFVIVLFLYVVFRFIKKIF